MNERIKELVKQAGGHFTTHNLASNSVQHRASVELWNERIEKFAELVAADEREACAKLCDTYETASLTSGSKNVALIFQDCSARIRARGQA